MVSREEPDIAADPSLKDLTFGEVSERLSNRKKAKGMVYKKPDARSKWAFCFSFIPGEYNEAELLELIGAEYGPGDYPVVFRYPDKDGKALIRWSEQWAVQERRLGAAQPPTLTAPPAAPVVGDGLAAAIENQSRMLEAVLSKLADPPPQRTTAEVVKELVAYKELFSGDRQSAIEMFKDAMQLKKLILDEDGGGDSDPLTAALKFLAPAIEKGVEQLRENEAAMPVPRVRPIPVDQSAAAAPAPPAPAPSPEVTGAAEPAVPTQVLSEEALTDQAFVQFTQAFVPAALQLAEQKKDPAGVAEWLMQLIGGRVEVIDMVGRVLAADDMVERIAALDDRVMPFAHWFDSVGDHLAHALWPELNPAPEAPGATNDATNDEDPENQAIKDGETARDPNQASDDELVDDGSGEDAQHPKPPGAGDGNDP